MDEELWTVDDVPTPVRYVYDTIDPRDSERAGYAIFGRAKDGTRPRIAWVDAVNPEMAKANGQRAKLMAQAPVLRIALKSRSQQYHDATHQDEWPTCPLPPCLEDRTMLEEAGV